MLTQARRPGEGPAHDRHAASASSADRPGSTTSLLPNLRDPEPVQL